MTTYWQTPKQFKTLQLKMLPLRSFLPLYLTVQRDSREMILHYDKGENMTRAISELHQNGCSNL